MNIKVIHIAYSDAKGGAAKATYRIYKYLQERQEILGVHSKMRVVTKLTQDKTVNGNRPSKETTWWRFIRPSLVIRYYKGFTLGKRTSFSVAWPKTQLLHDINSSNDDIVHLHWLGNDTLSIEEIGKINKPIVWLFHDMWAFCGAEHYVTPPPHMDIRYVEGYKKSNRLPLEDGKDLNRITWKRKKKAWKNKMHVVCPSNWLANCVRNSDLMKGWPVTVIPNSIDLEKWKPHDTVMAKTILGLPLDSKIILFGAMGGVSDPRKGGDLLLESLQKLKDITDESNFGLIHLVVFGQDTPEKIEKFSFPIKYMGYLDDDISLSLLYSAADVMVIPSRQDNLPNTGLESSACGTPLVAFNIGGLPDIINHKENGWLAEPFDTEDLAKGIKWVLEDEERHKNLSRSARQLAEERYHPDSIAKKYMEVYQQVLKENKK